MLTITVIIATYNRSRVLAEALKSLLAQECDGSFDFDVIVADNNSTDNTREVVESFIPSSDGKLRYIFEGKQGKSFAVNKGLKAARGDIIVLSDDDCTFESDYIANVAQTFKEAGDSVGFIGGRILPRWAGCSKPAWLTELKPGRWWYKEFFWGPLAILDYGESPFMLDFNKFQQKHQLFYGANMAVRKDLFVRHGGFNTEKTNTHDTEFQLRFLRKGERGLYAPDVKVYHKVTAGRLSPDYYYRWYYQRGTLLEADRNYRKKFYHPFGIQWALIAQTVKLWIGSVFAPSQTDRIYQRSHAYFNLGQMKQLSQRQL